ncbi:lysin B [Gordonia phage Syleon]|uniref:Lysin B n=1 Tax=Gordonia phage Syleon TaxID=2653718 RepID=A0A5Q2WG53_9CAUD|nr:lysin B [Gordonia phage Syleon]QGH75844.1 lysin B [Gordonia phage Syleon]
MRIILCRGIGEPASSPMLRTVTTEILKLGYVPEVVNLPWKAQYGPVPDPLGDDFHDALAHGKELLRRELDKGPAVVLGYSGGAQLAGDFVVDIGHHNLIALGLVADPGQPKGATGNYSRWGITGARIPFGTPTAWIADPNDGIPLCPANSPLRTLADQSEKFSLIDPVAWGFGLWIKLVRGDFQKVDAFKQFTEGEWWEAADLLHGYVFGRDHTSYGTRIDPRTGNTYSRDLAEWVVKFL